MSYLKVEILLPLYHNKDKTGRRKKIDGGRYLETFNDIMDKFGGCTIDNTPLLGGWVDPDTKKRISDENKTYWVVCKKTRENIEFFHKLKKRLKIRFEQQDIMIYYVIINKF